MSEFKPGDLLVVSGTKDHDGMEGIFIREEKSGEIIIKVTKKAGTCSICVVGEETEFDKSYFKLKKPRQINKLKVRDLLCEV